MSVQFEIYKVENGEVDEYSFNEFSFDLNMRIIDIRDEIMWKMYDSLSERNEQDEYYLEMINVTSRLYKDFGKLFFNFGIQPKTIDNYPLSKMTNEGRTFIFHVYRVKKSELKDYVSLKRIWEMTDEEKSNFENKPVSAKKEEPSWTKNKWDDENDENDEEDIDEEIEKIKKMNYDRFLLEQKKYTEW
jgi:hypothetical protein